MEDKIMKKKENTEQKMRYMNTNSKKSIIIKTVLKRELGWKWFLFLFKCLLSSKSLFKNTQWSELKNAESDFIKPYSLVAMVYIRLKDKFGKERAFQIMREIVVPVGCNQQISLLNSINISDDEPMKRLMAFHNLMDKKGATQFNDRQYVKKNNDICYFKIKRCVFKDFFDAVEVPEITGLFCEVDKEFFSVGFPRFKTYRGSSWENTLAFGRPECDFIFKRLNDDLF